MNNYTLSGAIALAAALITIFGFFTGIFSVSGVHLPSQQSSYYCPIDRGLDCVNDRGAAEQMICHDKDLCDNEFRLNDAYYPYRDTLGDADRETLKNAEIQFINNRDACREPGMKECILNITDQRIDEFHAQAGK